MKVKFQTPKWAESLIDPSRYKAAKGGRAGGKSHFFCSQILKKCLINPDFSVVCIREKYKSLRLSTKRTLANKINQGLHPYFREMDKEIRSKRGKGLIEFHGMLGHTADSIKSLEDFDLVFVDEANKLSKYSLSILIPTIRKEGSELWFAWNPEYENDPIERVCRESESCKVVHVNFTDNPFRAKVVDEEAERHRQTDPDTYDHVWLGGYRKIGDAQVFKGKWEIRDFEVDDSFKSPLHGMDFGFSGSPTTIVRIYVKDNVLYIRKEYGSVKLELNDITRKFKEVIHDVDRYVIRADSARPDSISYLKRNGLPRIESVVKGKIEDGIEFMRAFDRIVIHPECVKTAKEFTDYSHKTDPRTEDILPDIIDANNHFIDAIRYALQPLIKKISYNMGNAM